MLADSARRLGISEADSLRLQLIAEELFVNTVTHGFQRDCDAPVSFRLSNTPSGTTLRYADSAPPYDPTCRAEQTALAGVEGGLGVTLIRGMSRDFRYQRQSGQNICEILL